MSGGPNSNGRRGIDAGSGAGSGSSDSSVKNEKCRLRGVIGNSPLPSVYDLFQRKEQNPELVRQWSCLIMTCCAIAAEFTEWICSGGHSAVAIRSAHNWVGHIIPAHTLFLALLTAIQSNPALVSTYRRSRFRCFCRTVLAITIFSMATWHWLLQGGQFPQSYLIIIPIMVPTTHSHTATSLVGGFLAVNIYNAAVILYGRPVLQFLVPKLFSPTQTCSASIQTLIYLVDALNPVSHGELMHIARLIVPINVLALLLTLAGRHMQTRVKQREKSLRSHFIAFESLLSSLPCIIWSVDRDLRLKIHRDSVFGHSQFIDGVSIDELEKFSDTEISIIAERHRKAIELGEEGNYTLESVTSRLDKKVSSLEVRLRPLRDLDTGQIIGAVGVGIDVTNLIRTQKELKRSKEKYCGLIDCIADTIVCIDRNLIVRYINNGDAEAMNLTRERLLGKSLLRVFTPDVARKFEQVLLDVIEHNRSSTFEWLYDKETGHCFLEGDVTNEDYVQDIINGRVCSYMARIKSLSSLHKGLIEDDSSDQALLSIRDMTESKRSAERKRMVEKMRIESRSKSDFIRQLSHEIRNPLTVIIGSLQLMSTMDPKETPSVAIMEQIRDSMECAQLLVGILDEVLDLEKLEQGKVALSEYPNSVLDIVDAAAMVHRSNAILKGLDLITYVDPRMPRRLIFDRTRIMQILSNFLSNSIKFTESGFVRLSAEVIDETADAVNVKFSISDTGIGIPSSEIPRIFNLYYQVNGNYNPREYRGFGVGLGIVKRLVEMMDGSIDVVSEYGSGTTFSIVLPLRKIIGSKDSLVVSHSEPPKSKYDTVVVMCNSAEYRDALRKYLEAFQVRSTHYLPAPWECEEHLQLPPTTTFEHFEKAILECSKDAEPSRTAVIIELCKGSEVMDIVKMLKKRGMTCILIAQHDDEVHPWQKECCTVVKKPVSMGCIRSALCCEKCTMQESPHDASPVQKSLIQHSVLVVEDNAVVQRVLVRLLQKIGFVHITTANNGKEAVDIIEKTPADELDIVLMDLQMPVMSGIEATELVRKMANDDKRNIPIVAVTANCDRDMLSMCRRTGFNDLVQKPITAESLSGVIQRVILDSRRTNKRLHYSYRSTDDLINTIHHE